MQSTYTLLNAVTATGASAQVSAARCRLFSFFIAASAVTTGATVKIQALAPDGTWADLSSNAIAANGTTLVQKEGVFGAVRANITARTDGTYTVTAELGSYAHNE